MGLFFSCVPTSRMALTYRKKIQKEGNATIDELEQNIAQALYDLEQGSDLKSEMKYLFILSAKEVVVAPNKSAIVVVIPFRQITQFRRIHTRLVHELEKKFAKNVVIIAQRRILQKPGRNNRVSAKSDPTAELSLLFTTPSLMRSSSPLRSPESAFATSSMVPSNSRSTWTRRTSPPWSTSWTPSAPSTESSPARRPFSPSTANTDKWYLLVTNKLIK